MNKVDAKSPPKSLRLGKETLKHLHVKAGLRGGTFTASTSHADVCHTMGRYCLSVQ